MSKPTVLPAASRKLKDNILTPDQAADILSLSPTTLARWRCQGMGPSYIKHGGMIRYRLSGIERFLDNVGIER